MLDFPDSTGGKESTCIVGDARDVGSIPGSGRSPGGGHGKPLQYSCLKNPHGQRSLEGYSPWGHEESDMTEHAHVRAHTHTLIEMENVEVLQFSDL